MASSGDLREDVAAALTKAYSDIYPGDDTNVTDVDQFAADAAIAVVRAHDAAHPEPWAVELAQSYHFEWCYDRCTPTCLSVPESVRSAAGLT